MIFKNFYVFEGGEGSGKSTQIQLFKKHLERDGKKVFITRDPGGTNIADGIRGILLDPDNSNINPLTELLLYTASREQLIDEVICPKLADGYFVLCDRFDASTYVYQGIMNNLLDKMVVLSRITTDVKPEVTIFLDVDAKIGLRRSSDITKVGEGRQELLGLDFHIKVNQVYRDFAKLNETTGRYVTIDTNLKSISEVSEDIIKKITER